MNNNSEIKVLGVFNLLPVYRMAISRKLWSDQDIDYTICAGSNTNSPSLNVISESILPEQVRAGKFFTLRNYWIGKHFLWQEGVYRPSFTKDYNVVIHTGSMYQLSTWVALLIGKAQGKRQLLWTHGLRTKEDNAKGMIRRIFYNISDGLLLYGHRAKELLIDYGFDSDKLYVIYNSLDYEKQCKQRNAVTQDEINSVKQQFFSQPQLPLLIYIGRITGEKKPLQLADLVIEMKRRGQPINLLVIGDGPELSSLESNVSASNLNDCLHVYGPCHDEIKLAPMMLAADLAIMPGYIGLSAMHYMAYGLPVLTSDDLANQKPEVEAIIEGLTGDYYEHGNTSSLANKVSEWISKVGPECRSACINQIETFYNPSTQHMIINHACMGLPASEQPYKDNPGFKSRRTE